VGSYTSVDVSCGQYNYYYYASNSYGCYMQDGYCYANPPNNPTYLQQICR